MHCVWFQRFGCTYRPLTWHGYVIWLAAIGAAIGIFERIDSRSHSASDTLIGAVPLIVLLALGVHAVASRLSATD